SPGGCMRTIAVFVLAGLLCGCTRSYYRRSADKETYRDIEQRNGDPQWHLPRIIIDPAPESRLYDPDNPDHPRMPPDDPAADRYVVWVEGMKAYKKWHRDGDAPWIEDPRWRNFLPLNDKGELVLTPERAVELGLLDSREYQVALDQLYLTALALT